MARRSCSWCRTTATRSAFRTACRRRRHRSRCAPQASGCQASASTATTSSPCTARCARRWSGRAAVTGRHSSKRSPTASRRTRPPTTPPDIAATTRRAEWRARDPVERVPRVLREGGVVDERFVAEVDAEGEAIAARMRDFLFDAPAGDPREMFDHVYATPTPQLEVAARDARAGIDGGRGDVLMELTMAGALNAALRDSMREDDTVVVYGEDVGKLGGVFRITDGLQAEMGADRCFDTPGRRVGHRRHRDRHGALRAASGGRDAVRRLLLPGAQPGDQPRREVPQPDARTGRPAAGDPHPLRRRHRRRGASLGEPGGVLRAHGGAHRRLAGDARRRLRAAPRIDRVRRPGDLPRAQATLLVEGGPRPAR